MWRTANLIIMNMMLQMLLMIMDATNAAYHHEDGAEHDD